MLLKDSIYIIATVVIISSLLVLVKAIKNKYRNTCNYTITISLICMINLFFYIILIPIKLNLDTGLEFLFLYFFASIAAIINIVTIIICLIKNKKYAENQENLKKLKIIIMLLMLFPALLISIIGFRQKYLINNSDIILIYYSHGNGGFGDGKTFAYAINDIYCEQFDLGINYHGYKIEDYLPKTSRLVSNNEKNLNSYEIKLENNKIIVYKDNKCIHEKKHKYFNIELEKEYYIDHK